MKTTKIKRTLSAALLIAMLFSLTACGSTPYDYDLDEYIKFGDYTKISISAGVAMEYMEKSKQELINSHATPSAPITDRNLKVGDIAVVSYKCYTEEIYNSQNKGTAAPVLEDTDCHIVLGRGKYPAALESAILATPPSTATPTEVRVALPANYGITSLAGQNVVFIFTVSYAYSLTLPEFNDEFVSTHTPYPTVAEYERAVTEQGFYQAVWDELVEISQMVSYPASELNEHTLDFIEYYTNLAVEEELTLESYIKRKFFIELSAFHIKADEFAKAYTKEETMVYCLSRSNGLELTDNEYEERAQKYVVMYGYESLSALERDFSPSFVRYTVLKDKVMEFVADNSFTEWEV
ncbi:MAG: hypothetical protein IKB34_01430 [Clostridia bacterium]|nr:hypothetical protein [Clostridia bacterium]